MVLTFLSHVMPSCKSPDEGNRTQDPAAQKEDLIRNQQHIVRDESLEIDEYIARRNLDMTTTQTGLRYKIYHQGSGNKSVEEENWVKINYSVSLLDGTTVYSSDSSGALEFQVGKSDIATGLQEGVKQMKEGDKALFIIPSHLAYGLTGDGDQIKHYAALVIDAELIKINGQP